MTTSKIDRQEYRQTTDCAPSNPILHKSEPEASAGSRSPHVSANAVSGSLEGSQHILTDGGLTVGSVQTSDLDVSDIVTFRRVWHPDDDLVIAVVVNHTPRGPLLDGPDFVTPVAARSGVVKDVLNYDDLIGLDATGHYHVFSRNSGCLDVRTATDIEHQQTLCDQSLRRWIRHVDNVRGWEELASRFTHALEGGESA